MSDMLNPGGGYGNLFGYNVTDVRADGFEVKHFGPQILRYAIPSLVFGMGLNESRDAFGVGKGGTFSIPIMNDWAMPTSVTPLVSGTSIGLGTQKTDKVQMSMYEYGTGVGYETLTDWMTNLKFQTEIQITLGRYIARMINWLDYDVLVNTIFSIEVVAAGSYTNLLGTNRKLPGSGTLGQAAYGELGYGGVALAYDTMKANLVAPINARNMYLWFANGATLRNLKAGSVFQNQFLYNKISSPTYNILGEFENFIFVETEEQLSKGTSIVTGANAGGYGFGLNPRTFFYPDFGNDAERLKVFKTLFYRGQDAIMRDKGTTTIVVRSKSTSFSYGGLG